MRGRVLVFTGVLIFGVAASGASTTQAVQGTIETPLADLVPTPQPPKVVYNILSYNFIGESDMNRGQGEVVSINSLRATFALDSDTSIRLNQDFSNNWISTGSGSGRFAFLDPHVQVARSNLLAFESGIVLNGFVRYYAPLGVASQRANTGGGFRFGAEVAKRFFSDKLLVAYNFIPQVNLINQGTYLNADGKLQGSRRGHLLHYAEVAYTFSPKLMAYTDLGFSHVSYVNDSRVTDRTGKDHTYLYANLAVTYLPVPFFEVELGLNEIESRDLSADNTYFAVYREEDTSYYLQARVIF